MSLPTPISTDDHQQLLAQYNEFFWMAMGRRSIPMMSNELLKFADVCDLKALNLEEDTPELAADLVEFAKNCREVANRTSGK